MKTETSKPAMVEHMREIRDQLSNEIMNMTLAEERAYISEQLKKLKAKREKSSS